MVSLRRYLRALALFFLTIIFHVVILFSNLPCYPNIITKKIKP
ncbi:hypothetical protein X231_1200 [Streptococcus pneumoniae ECC_3510]|nr:hypothetical protein X231_1200 [Streptococcus pneumoniae ECC_3510]